MTADSPSGPVVILTAMPDEASAVRASLAEPIEQIDSGTRTYERGLFRGHDVVVAVSRCGKVAAASMTADAIVRFSPSAVLFTGVAGGIGPEVAVGDVVVADRLIQHDLDPRPLWPRHVVPLLEVSEFPTCERWTAALSAAAEAFATSDGSKSHTGLVVSGDQFIHDREHAGAILDALPAALCVEMEGAAAAQVAYEYAVPFALVRSISDRADADAPSTFLDSLGSFAASHSLAILEMAFDMMAVGADR
ncbi:MAG: 5'-methylthioadenosine/S-adenosylhomocysteine nucleosidase [Phycisphaerae bacterium]|nr:5'-methylthioadenosine/S-adenosylhomocysteine nucleosidase [Phycisphaerae bacterium]